VEKRCPHCEETKPLEQFYRSKRSADGRDAYCKPCRDGLGAERRARERASRPVPTPVTHKACIMCGETKPVAEFYKQRNECKQCSTIRHREYVQQPEVAERIRRYQQSRAAGKWKRPPRREPHASGFEVCTMCNLDKPLDEFHKHKLGRNGTSSLCKECSATISRVRREDAAVRSRENDQRRVRLYGLEAGQYDELLAAQNGVCAICHEIRANGRGLHIDHDHVTGAVRGLLCTTCNTGLGAFKDRVDLLEEAVRYLTR
jgi:hypothetical protein